jgi:RNA polymerase sigma factor for flagellar operon FliA
MEAAVAAAEQRLQAAPGEEEIARELGVTVEEYRDWLLDTKALSLGSIEWTTEGDETGNLLDYVSDSEENLPTRRFERRELERLLAEAISRMPKVERTVLNLYYTDGLNLREIAGVLNLHVTRISQLKTQAVLRLRAFIEKRWPSERGMYR